MLYSTTGVDAQDEHLWIRSVQWGGSMPVAGAPGNLGAPNVATDCSTEATCAPPLATGDGGVAQLSRKSSAPYDTVFAGNYQVSPGTGDGTLVDSDGPWTVYNGPNGTQYIGTSTVAGLSG